VDDARKYLPRVGAATRAIAARDLAVDHGGPERLLSAPIGRIDARIKQETKDGWQFDRQMRGEALHRRQRAGRHDAIGQSVEEVAEIVGIPENTVKTRMFYARKRLAELLKSEGIERGWP